MSCFFRLQSSDPPNNTNQEPTEKKKKKKKKLFGISQRFSKFFMGTTLILSSAAHPTNTWDTKGNNQVFQQSNSLLTVIDKKYYYNVWPQCSKFVPSIF